MHRVLRGADRTPSRCPGHGEQILASQSYADQWRRLTRSVAHDRHSGGARYIFADGHTKRHRGEQTLTPKLL